jgi:hypothetical protein
MLGIQKKRDLKNRRFPVKFVAIWQENVGANAFIFV